MEIPPYAQGLCREAFSYKVYGKGRDRYFVIDYLGKQLSEGHRGDKLDAERAIDNLLTGFASRKYYNWIEYINKQEEEND